MQRLQPKLRAQGLCLPVGLMNILKHHGSSRKDVYRAMYGQLVYGGKLTEPGTTLVYPEDIRCAVRERFTDDGAGVYDVQYESKGFHVTLKQMIDHRWRPPRSKCTECKKRTSKPY